MTVQSGERGTPGWNSVAIHSQLLSRFWRSRPLAPVSSPGFLLGAGPSSVYERLLSSAQPVCPMFNPFVPPPPWDMLLLLFFFFFFELLMLTAACWCPRVIFSVFSFSLEAFVNTRWQLNPGDLLLCPHLPSAPALLSWLRPCNRRRLCCGLPHPRSVPHCQGFLKYPDSFVCKFTVASVAGK